MDYNPMGSAVPARFGPGSLVASYVLEEMIGSGGMAEVWRAHDERNARKVALKILAPNSVAGGRFRQRFLRESRLVVQLDHAHIIPVYEATQDGELLFIAMRLVRGGDVRSLLGHRPLPPGQVAEIVSQVAEALDFAHQMNFGHERGLVHRDVKPGNMLLAEVAGRGRRDHVYLCDFGAAKPVPDVTHSTPTGLFVGTPDYMAPEQFNGEKVDGRADQYSLACSAFELLCGEPPFHRYSAELIALANAHQSNQPPPVSARRPDVRGEVDEVFFRALAKVPVDRYPTCAKFATDLQSALDLPPRGIEPTTTHRAAPPPSDPGAGMTMPDPPMPADPEAGRPRSGKWRTVTVSAAAAIVAATATAAVAYALPGRSATPRPAAVSITAPARTLHCQPSRPQCQFTVGGQSAHVSSGLRIFVLVFPLRPAGAGWYPQAPPARIAANGGWNQSPSNLGSAQYPVHNGDILQIEALVVRAGASYQGADLAVLAATASPISDPGQIHGVLSRSAIVALAVRRPPGPPPPPSTVTSLMAKEAAGAKAHNVAAALSLYAPTAFVMDAECPTHGSSRTWPGLTAIKTRYQGLPAFSALRHSFAQVQFMPPNSQAVTALVMAQTVGVIAPSATSPRPQYIQGNELWTFALLNGKWLITSFSYNVCYSPNGG